MQNFSVAIRILFFPQNLSFKAYKLILLGDVLNTVKHLRKRALRKKLTVD